ncbi:type VI secretion system Vgr family protein [Paraburkholderia caffeinilytica]|uniref:type VI secretion system Vgr family protein n=1 Tax=Paraburkholderia caffeinilytica TaxID=1761016 RepID=UPI003DA09A3E
MFKAVQSRTLAISSSALPVWGGQPILTAQRLSGFDKLGKLFKYTVDVMTVDEPTLGLGQAKELVSAGKLVGTVLDISIEFEGKGTFVPGARGAAGDVNVGADRRAIIGLITKVRCTGADDRRAYYRFTVRPWLWLATLNCENRIFQNQNVAEITDSVLKEKRYGYPFELRLAGPAFDGVYPKRDYVRQMWESDFEFLRRLWCEWGLYFFMEGSTLVLCDSPGAHKRHGEAYETIRYYAPDGKQIDEEHIFRLDVSRELTAGAVSLIDYDYTRSRANLGVVERDEGDASLANAEHYGWGDYSQPLAGASGLSGEPNIYAQEARDLARVRVDALRCRRLRARGTGNLRGLTTGRTFHLEGYPLEKANTEYLVASTTIDIRNVDETSRLSGSKVQYQCVTKFVLQPANTFFKNRPKTKKPRCGAETAVVVGPQDRPIWVDGYARVKVQFVWDRRGKRDLSSSCWVRVSSPWQGNGFGFVALPRVGQEVTVSYHEGDPDKPYISGRMVNQLNQPPWDLPKNEALTGLLSRDLDGGKSNSLVADDTPGKLQVQVTSDHAQSRLVLGYNTRIVSGAGRQEARGEGAELATDAWAVFRANRGMLVTTETRAGAAQPVKDMGETVQRLTQAGDQHEALARLAQQHKAQGAEASQQDATQTIRMQNDAVRGGAKTTDNPSPEMTRPDVVLASAAGIATTATNSTHMASVDDHAITAGRDYSVSAGRSCHVSVRGAISLFAYRQGMTFMAAKGRVDIQAQSDQMALAALKDLTISSTDGRVVITAAREVWIGAGGSYIQINGSGIVNGSPGPILEKTPSWDVPAASSQRVPLPVMPVTPLAQNPEELYAQTFDVSTVVANQGDGLALFNQPYRICLPDGTLKQQGMLSDGATLIVNTLEPVKARCEIGAGVWGVIEDAYDQHQLDDDSEQV